MNANPGIIASILKLPMTTAIPRVPHIRINSIIRIRNGMIFSTLQVNSPAVRRTACSPPKLRFSCMILSRISIQEQTTNTALTKNVCQVCCSNRFHARLVSVLTLAENSTSAALRSLLPLCLCLSTGRQRSSRRLHERSPSC